MRRALLAAAAAALLAGCATVPAGGPAAGSPTDPWEAWNRKVFAFNDAIDQAIAKPVARGYVKVVPEPVRTVVANFFGNLGDVWSTVNQLLQGKPVNALNMGMRVAVNSSFGLGGLLDVATPARLPRLTEDFGQTLGVWGLPSGAYLVLPLLGPSSVRDGTGLGVDLWLASPNWLVDARAAQVGVTVLQFVNARAGLLTATDLVDEVALDRYVFLRDAYLQRRRTMIYDGVPPLEFDDIEDEPPATAPAVPAPAASAAGGS